MYKLSSFVPIDLHSFMLANVHVKPTFSLTIWSATSVWASLLLLMLPHWHGRQIASPPSMGPWQAAHVALQLVALCTWCLGCDRWVTWCAFALAMLSMAHVCSKQWHSMRGMLKDTIPTHDGSFTEHAALANSLAQIQLNQHLREDWQRVKRDQLRAQMNPHFLFNVLTGIQHTIIAGELDRASHLFSKFRELMVHGFLGDEQPLGTLLREVQHLEAYLELEGVRLTHSVAFSVRAASDCPIDSIPFPLFILQPLVENALWHGLDRTDFSEARIELNVRWEEHDLLVEVKDNGKGLPEQHGQGHRSRGTEIIRSRLKLLPHGGSLSIDNIPAADGQVVGVASTIRLRQWRNVPLEF